MAESELAAENERKVRRIVDEAWNEGEFEVIDEIYADDHVASYPGTDPVTGPEEYKDLVRTYHTAMPDFHVEIHDLFATDDHVVLRYTVTGTHEGPMRRGDQEIPATGKELEYDGLALARVEDGEFTEEYNRADTLVMLEQMGLLPE